MRRGHLIIGLLGIAVFVATGWIMKVHSPPLITLGEATRLMYRSRHIYILGVALANLLLGLYFTTCSSAMGRFFQRLGGALLLSSLILLVAAFFAEPAQGFGDELWRTRFGWFALLGGALAHLVARGVDARVS